MTNRYHSLTVALSRDMRDDDAEGLVNAIKMMRGVIDVSGNVTNDITSYVAQARAHRELADKLWDVLYPKEPTK
jgi:hypothetical protein